MAAVDLNPVAPRRASVSLSWVLTTSVPVILFVLFAIGHVQSWERTGHLTGALLVAQELVLVVLFVFRRRPVESSRHPLVWFVAVVGSFSSLLLRPAEQSSVLLDDFAFLLQVVGAGASIFCLISLGRSFGIVAANRGREDRRAVPARATPDLRLVPDRLGGLSARLADPSQRGRPGGVGALPEPAHRQRGAPVGPGPGISLVYRATSRIG